MNTRLTDTVKVAKILPEKNIPLIYVYDIGRYVGWQPKKCPHYTLFSPYSITLHTGMLDDIQVSFVRHDGPIRHSQGLVSHETNSCKHTQSVQQSLTYILNSTGPKQLYYNQTVEQTIDTPHIVIFLPVEAHLSGLLTFQVSLQQVLFEEVYLKSRIPRES